MLCLCIIYERKIKTENIRHGSISKPIRNGMDGVNKYVL